MNTIFQDFIQMCVRKLRGEDDEEELIVDYVCNATFWSITKKEIGGSLVVTSFYSPQVEKNINNMTVKMPHQLFINGEFVDAEGGKTYKTINPNDGTVRKSNSGADGGGSG